MKRYKFCWPSQLYYPDIPLAANPGDEAEFDAPPDSRWIPVEPPAPEAPPSKSQARRPSAAAGE